MFRTLSSDFGSRCSKLSQASYKIADGAVDPGRNIDMDDTILKKAETVNTERQL